MFVTWRIKNSEKIKQAEVERTKILKQEKIKKEKKEKLEQKKQKAIELLGEIKTEDAYMYEDKEGVRIIFNDNIQDKIDILPHSLHIWYEFTQPVTEFCEWLLENVYLMKEHDKSWNVHEK